MVDKKPKRLSIDWAEIVDLFSREYGWTLEDIKKLTLPQILILIRAIQRRYQREKEAMDNGTKKEASNEEKVRNLALSLGGKVVKNKDGREEIII
jgi:hypothetical protein